MSSIILITITLISSLTILLVAVMFGKRGAGERPAPRGPTVTELLPELGAFVERFASGLARALPPAFDGDERARVIWRLVRDRVKQLDHPHQLLLMRRMQALAARPERRLTQIAFDINALANPLIKRKNLQLKACMSRREDGNQLAKTLSNESKAASTRSGHN